MRNRMRKITTLLLGAVLLFGMVSVLQPRAAAESLQPKAPIRRITSAPIASQDELLEGFLYTGIHDLSGISAYSGDQMEQRLEGVNLAFYKAIKQAASEIAAGDRDEAIVTITPEEAGLAGRYWTAEELGVSDIIEYDEDGEPWITQAASDAFEKAVGFSLRLVMNAVRADCPYEMYWAGLCSASVICGADRIDGEWKARLADKATIWIEVSTDYQDVSVPVDEDDFSSAVDVTKTGAAAQTVKNISAILEKYTGSSDRRKLHGYMEELCALNTYNHAAAAAPDGTYGDPWQLIYMFDGDPATRVVCEGYSKSFQYLCENTVFASDEIQAYSVSGIFDDLKSVRGPHMWNLVHMDDGKNYLVDVTNADREGTIDESLFLAPANYGTWDTAYLVGKSDFQFSYDDDTKGLYTSEELTLASVDICAEGHDEAVLEAIQPTCTSEGLTEGTYCTRCGRTLTAQTPVEKLSHKLATVPGTAATCTEAGLTDGSRCTVCDAWIVPQENIPAPGHTWDETYTIDREATCEVEGEQSIHCANCEETKDSQTIEKLAHTPETVPGKEATCSAEGWTEGVKCKTCGFWITERQPIGKKDHVPVVEVEPKDPTCEEDGCTVGTRCEVCEDTVEKSTVIPKLEHQWGEYTLNGDQTCTEDGTKTALCTREGCSETNTVEATGAKLGHAWGEYKSDNDATCTEDGHKTASCTRDGCTAQDRVVAEGTATGHTPGAEATETGPQICTVCEKVLVPALGHNCADKATTIAVKPATDSADGTKAHYKCDCGKLFEDKACTKEITADQLVISKVKSVTIASGNYTYDGKVKNSAVTVKDAEGTTLVKGTDYTVTYSKGCKDVGSYTVTVKGKGNYSFTKTLTFKINPVKTAIAKLTAGKKAFTVKWKKKTTQVSGYEIQYSLKKNFASGNKTVAVKGASTVSKTIKKLKAGKTYYVRVRTYKTVGKTKFYSDWSAAKSIKTKK